jgi:hypothetical protein
VRWLGGGGRVRFEARQGADNHNNGGSASALGVVVAV